jgi:hypothetical protein
MMDDEQIHPDVIAKLWSVYSEWFAFGEVVGVH